MARYGSAQPCQPHQCGQQHLWVYRGDQYHACLDYSKAGRISWRTNTTKSPQRSIAAEGAVTTAFGRIHPYHLHLPPAATRWLINSIWLRALISACSTWGSSGRCSWCSGGLTCMTFWRATTVWVPETPATTSSWVVGQGQRGHWRRVYDATVAMGIADKVWPPSPPLTLVAPWLPTVMDQTMAGAATTSSWVGPSTQKVLRHGATRQRQ